MTLNRASTYLQHIMIYKVATDIIWTWLELRIWTTWILKNVSEAICVSQRHRQTGWFCGEVAHRRTLRKRCSSQGMQSFESAMKSYSSWAWSNKALKRGWWSKPIFITYLLCFSPTYTTKWPFGTSLGISEQPSCKQHHQARSQHSSQDMHLLRHIFLHLLRHPLRNLDFIVSCKMERESAKRER